MSIILKEISENDFNDSKGRLLFESKGVNRKFALLGDEDVYYVIGWQSDLINPKNYTLTQCNEAIGVDLNFAIIDFCKSEVLVKMDLSFNFISLVQAKNKLFVLTELEFLELDSESYDIVNTCLLPDVLDEIIVSDEDINLKCVDGRVVKLFS